MRIIYRLLPDGGEVEPTKQRVVPIGDDDDGAYEQLTYRRAGIEVVFEVWDRVPVCTKIALAADRENGKPLRAKDLADIRLDELREDAFATAGVFERNPAGGWIHKLSAESFGRDRRKVQGAARRRKITPELLQRVAQTHAAAEGARVAAVADEFGVTMRTAHRYIAAARAADFIATEREVSQ
jgi:hypothetical protein